jgi:hypothetical protein
MSKRGVEKFLYRFDKDEALTAAFKADPRAALAGLELDPAEREALAARDVAALHRWGVHPLLIRNFSGALGIDYVAKFKAAGIDG